MDLAVVLLTGLALSMDAFTVSVSKGMTIKNLKPSLGIKIALSFGIFSRSYALYWMVTWNKF